MKTPREIAEMVNHGNDVDDFERYIEYCELAAANAYDECKAVLTEITDIAVEPGTDPMLAVIEMQRIAQGAINKIGGSPDEPPPRTVLKVVK